MTKIPIDLERVKSEADLLAICHGSTTLKKAAASGGGEWAGPCPICGGRDRFRVQPYANPGRWLCRNCTGGAWDSVIGYIARRDNLDVKRRDDLEEICRRAVGDLPTTTTKREPPPNPAYSPPTGAWQQAARQVINECQAALWDSKYHTVLEYLRGRGLNDNTIKRFKLGYCATGNRDVYNRDIAGLRIPRGILIPSLVAGEIWYLKIRFMPGVPVKCSCGAILPGPGDCPDCGKNIKYTGVKGNRPAAIYNADTLGASKIALFCEGEFDCMIAHQVLNGILPCVTMGSATNTPDLATWGGYILPLRVILACYDLDRAGEKGAERLSDLAGERIKLAPLPEGVKDINDFYQGGGDLCQWIKPYLEFWDEEVMYWT